MNWSYVAGFFDGEGSVVRHGKTDYRISIPQTNEEVLKFIQSFTRSGNICKTKKRKEHWKESWIYTAAKQEDVLVFLQKIQPYLIVKRDLVLELIPIVSKVVLIQRKKRSRLLKNKENCKLLREKKLSYRAIGQKLGIDHGYVRRLILFDGRNR